MENGSSNSHEKAWRDNWQREIEGAYLYRRLSELARTPEIEQALSKMASQEEEHASLWADRIQSELPTAREPRPDLRVRLIALAARLFGSEAVLSLLINDEARDITIYAEQSRQLGDEETYQQVLSDETSHAYKLADLRGQSASETEPWHRGVSAGGMLRVVVYGFNDGLTANFGLVMGVIGAAVSVQTVLVAGFSGLLADALSMAASGFLAARSEQQVREHHLALERAELRLMPEEEREELAQYFQHKGLTADEASTAADRLMKNPDTALTELARDELGIDPEASESPLREGIVTGIATGIGAAIPLIPFFFLSGSVAVWTAVGISMVAHYAVGAGRAMFTGRPALRSGFDMFVVGMGVAVVTYLLGLMFGVRL